jgi:CheY-like chemotaxis protein
MRAQAANDGAEALSLILGKERFDIAILDMQMPGMDGMMLAAEIRKHLPSADLSLVMLTAMTLSGEMLKSAQSSCQAVLSKPIKQSKLGEVLARLLITPKGREGSSTIVQADAMRLDPRMAERLPLRILVAEDNAVNQKLAVRILQKLGYRADVAGNGLEAVAALRTQPYDAVLMDVQMPEMDGLEATRQICQEWPAKQRPRIIAMTASAIEGDREKCLEAGMDDYISKPVQFEELIQALNKCQTLFKQFAKNGVETIQCVS